MSTSLAASVVYLQHPFNFPYSQNLHFLPFKYSKSHKNAVGLLTNALQTAAALYILGRVNTTLNELNTSFVMIESKHMLKVNNLYR